MNETIDLLKIMTINDNNYCSYMKLNGDRCKNRINKGNLCKFHVGRRCNHYSKNDLLCQYPYDSCPYRLNDMHVDGCTNDNIKKTIDNKVLVMKKLNKLKDELRIQNIDIKLKVINDKNNRFSINITCDI